MGAIRRGVKKREDLNLRLCRYGNGSETDSDMATSE